MPAFAEIVLHRRRDTSTEGIVVPQRAVQPSHEGRTSLAEGQESPRIAAAWSDWSDSSRAQNSSRLDSGVYGKEIR